ncbi:MAG TPA: hypothetical protein VGI50_15680, partial [Solirubrobacteraceae bacterium]
MSRVSGLKARIGIGAAGLAAVGLLACWMIGLTGATAAGAAPLTLSTSTCHLGAPYKHVIYIQFDNQH